MRLLRRFIDFQLELTKEGKPLHFFHPLISATDTFFFEPKLNTSRAPHIRDAVDLKRWMMLVVIALFPCILMAIWNTGVQKLVYTSYDYRLMDEFMQSSHSLKDYALFCFKDGRWKDILFYGTGAFLPVMLISYMAGGVAEGIIACVRKHEIAEGFLVSGMLFALILPPTIPYWMVAFGVIFGIIISKELFGGTGMNIVNPAMTCRLLLFFTFPGQMSGDVWVGTNPTVVRESLIKMNKDAQKSGIDGYTQATCLAKYNIGFEVLRVHVDAIATSFRDLSGQISTLPIIKREFELWAKKNRVTESLGALPRDRLKEFIVTPRVEHGLGLSPEHYENAYRFATLQYGQGTHTNWNWFFGNKLGSFGETSILASLLGAIILIVTGVGSWRTMMGMILGGLSMASLLQAGVFFLGSEGGAWNPAMFGFPAYKHLLLGSFVFGAVFMATDPVSSPSMKLGRWIYGILIGVLAIVIRTINPAYPEGVMLATVVGNVFAPLIDHYCARWMRRRQLRVYS